MQLWHRTLNARGWKHDSRVFWTACILCFQALMRPDEIVQTTSGHSVLSWDNVLFLDSMARRVHPSTASYKKVITTELRLLRRKNDQTGANPTIKFAAVQGRSRFFCVPYTLWQLAVSQKVAFMSKHPVLTKTGGKQMTYTDLTSHVKDMMRTILRLKRDADPIGYKPYSLRKGGAAHMHNVGASLMDIQALGQWKSSAFKTYMEAASVRTVQLSKCMAKNIPMSMEPAILHTRIETRASLEDMEVPEVTSSKAVQKMSRKPLTMKQPTRPVRQKTAKRITCAKFGKATLQKGMKTPKKRPGTKKRSSTNK